MTLPKNLPALLRAAGLTVVEVDGWEDRGRPGLFAKVGVLNHHTGASARGWSHAKELQYARWMFSTGRSDLPAPLCQIALGRSGRVYIGAAGRANHAGKAKASGSVGAGDGNSLYIGIEWMLSGTEVIPAEMRQAGVLLNAVLSEKVTGHSVETISAHYQTSITGKWDIGDPNGVDFKGTRVMDMTKFRAAVKAAREDLYDRKQVGEKPHIKVRAGHISMQFSDTVAQWKHDAAAVFAQNLDWVTGTEAGEDDNYRVLKAAAQKRGYRMKRFGSNWVAVKKSIIKAGTFRWAHEVVVPNSQVVGPGHDTSVIWATFTHKTKGVGRITVMSGHNPTKGKPAVETKDPARRVNLRWTQKAARVVGRRAKELGTGANNLFFYGGDQNISDKAADTFFGQPLTSCWDELKKWPDTGHGNIDVIASYDGDKRVSCVRARVFTDKELFLHTDHLLVLAVYRINLNGA